MPIISINEKTIYCKNEESLYKVLLRGGIQLYASCGGMGTCGKCNVWVEGVGKVKSCGYNVTEDIKVSISVPKSEIATKGFLRNVKTDNFKPCIAIDIGTTTVVAYLIINGKIADIESDLNPQKPYGDDVIARIKYTADNSGGTQILHDLINNRVSEMCETLARRNSVQIESAAVAGNTTMLHLFANVSPKTIGTAPFKPVFTELRKIGNTTLLPSISGYVGADTVAAIVASGMHLSNKKNLLVDIGTNAEIALGSRHGITVCAAAAGPAFEGAQIVCGIGGVAGAINSIFVNGRVSYTTIDNMPPVGICGSAVIDAVAQMLNAGIIDKTGYFEGEELKITDEISIYSQDIRHVQLAKSAIAAGIKTLLAESGTSLTDIEACYLVGGFGSYLNKKSACDIGLIPHELYDKITVLGNAAGMGAVLWQISDKCKEEVTRICEISEYTELSDSAVFNEQFISNMYF